MNLASRFVQTAQRLPDKVAVHDPDGEHTYAEILAHACAVADQVAQRTDRPHVALLAPTSATFAAGYFGILLAGRAAVPLNFLVEPRTLAFVRRDAGFDLILTAAALAPLAEAIGPASLVLERIGATASAEASLPAPAAATDDTATLLYTSGTTGKPKGVVLTHGNFVTNVTSSVAHIHITEDDAFLGVLPLFHSFGITTSLLIPLLTGASAVYLPRFSPAGMVDAMASGQVSMCFAVASMFRVLLRAKSGAAGASDRLRFAIAGGEALGAATARDFEQAFGAALLEGYGLTETSPVVSVNLPDANRPGSAGRMLDWVEAGTFDDAEAPLPAGAEGELWFRGGSIAKGYHNRPDETQASFAPDGWFRTGDLGRVDDDGYLWITGRKKELIISAGENISPNEIEAVLHEHPAVQEAAVLGIPDTTRGEVPKAYVIPHEHADVSEADLAAWCRRHLPRFKVPTAFTVRADLPHGATGKIHKLTLRQQEGLG